MHIGGNFAIEGECGKCKHFLVCGVVLGVCSKDDYRDRITTDKCDIGKYEAE